MAILTMQLLWLEVLELLVPTKIYLTTHQIQQIYLEVVENYQELQEHQELNHVKVFSPGRVASIRIVFIIRNLEISFLISSMVVELQIVELVTTWDHQVETEDHRLISIKTVDKVCLSLEVEEDLVPSTKILLLVACEPMVMDLLLELVPINMVELVVCQVLAEV